MNNACKYPPPKRFWYETSGGWASREWKPGEREEYSLRVLGRTLASFGKGA